MLCDRHFFGGRRGQAEVVPTDQGRTLIDAFERDHR
jgi:hypothetical protein